MTLGSLIPIERPLIFFDLETTSAVRQTARIVSMAMRVHRPGGRMDEWHSLVNPGIPIPAESSKVHGITDEIIRIGCSQCWRPTEVHPDAACAEWKPIPTFEALAPSLFTGFSGADFGGYNIQFDVDVMVAEFKRVKMELDRSGARLLDGHRLWSKLEPRSLAHAVSHFLLGEKMTDAHNALADIRATERVVIAELLIPDGLPRDLQSLHDSCFPRDPNAIGTERKFVFINGVPSFNFGKHRGQPIASQRGFLQWIMKADFSPETKAIVSEALHGRYPQLQDPRSQAPDLLGDGSR